MVRGDKSLERVCYEEVENPNCLCMQLMIPSEAAHDTVAALGEIGMLQFKDLVPDKSAFQRTYANQVWDN